MPISKKKTSFNLTLEDKNRIVSYMTEMQSIGFGLSAAEVGRYMLNIAKSSGRERNPTTMHPISCVLLVMKNPTI
jgi:hypothetical protein